MEDSNHGYNVRRLWVLGAADPEMEAIEALLRDCGETVAYALDEHGECVRPGNAYHCAPIEDTGEGTVYVVECARQPEHTGRRLMSDAPAGVDHDDAIHRYWTEVHIDHHRPGDPGHGRPPGEFLPASSLGQVIAELARLNRVRVRREVDGATYFVPQSDAISRLGWDVVSGGSHRDGDSSYEAGEWDGETAARLLDGPELQLFPDGRWHILVGTEGHELGGCVDWLVVPRALVLTAAADHCLGAAYRGKCPGVDPDELMRFRAEQRARFQGRSVDEVVADIERAQSETERAPTLRVGYSGEAIPCDYHAGQHAEPGCGGCDDMAAIVVRDMRRPDPVPELPEAATRLGLGYVSGPLVGPDGRRKYTCSGTSAQVRAFIEQWAPAVGLVDTYGDPARGFAGGYEVQS